MISLINIKLDQSGTVYNVLLGMTRLFWDSLGLIVIKLGLFETNLDEVVVKNQKS